jgi:hypothetical protein
MATITSVGRDRSSCVGSGRTEHCRARALLLRANKRAFRTARRTPPGLQSSGAVGENVHKGSARLAKHEASDSPLLVAQAIRDLQPALDRPCC